MSVSPVNFKRVPEEYGRSFKEFVSDAYLHAGSNPSVNVHIDNGKVNALNVDTFERKNAVFDNNGNMSNLKIYKQNSDFEKGALSAYGRPIYLYRQYFYLAGSRVPSVAIEYNKDSDSIKEVTVYATKNHRTQPEYRDTKFVYGDRNYANVGTDEYSLVDRNDGSSLKVWRKN